jgi:hypothetical protein
MNFWEIIIEVILFVAASYLIFYRSYIKELGKKIAELSIVKDLTEKVESVKKKFNEDLESFRGNIQKDVEKEIAPLRAALDRANIGFQIYTSEYARLRFQRLDELYGSLYYFQRFVKDNLFDYIDEKDYESKRQSFFKISTETFDKIQLASLYLDKTSKASVYDLMYECYESFTAFIHYKNSAPGLLTPVFEGKSIIDLMVERHQNSIDRLEAARKKFPEILGKIEEEFKRNLTFEK